MRPRITAVPDHGTNQRYGSQVYRCRCELCRAAHRQTVKAWRDEVRKVDGEYAPRRVDPIPTRFRCRCGGIAETAEGHPGCQHRKDVA